MIVVWINLLFLTQCLSAMESLLYLVVLDHPHNVQCLVKKLPSYLQERWRREVTNLCESRKTLEFQHFVRFVKAEAKLATDPVFSCQALDKIGQDEKGKTNKGRISKFSNNAIFEEEKLIHLCIVCNAMHDLDNCGVYLKNSLPELELPTEEEL